MAGFLFGMLLAMAIVAFGTIILIGLTIQAMP